ncbi:siderophore-interacting protein [Undibacterium terreum]|uniref:Siderophore-interacting protein n=1 Tax=Undibacterium terreum TaxID=1224302 RepID=A0A916ULA8_9BURK|nr:siderophore-interacting protein [Undibacterium terreum]GGC75147.1 siderophore-interacting protein [Undibacterium terreum]
MNTNNTPDAAKPRQIERVRHTLKMRLLTVLRTEHLTPHMLRITLSGDDLDGFVSAAHDDHVKLFFPAPGSDQPTLPTLGQQGVVADENMQKPIARNYTPRRYDAVRKELDIDFMLHGDGPASLWAARAKPGMTLGVGGPRGSMVVPNDFDWYLLIGDQTALPAIARRLEELPAHAQVIAVIAVADAGEKIALSSDAQTRLIWLDQSTSSADTSDLFVSALKDLELPAGDGYAWVAAELNSAQTVRKYLLQERGLDKHQVHAASYWRNGASEHHQTHDDE